MKTSIIERYFILECVQCRATKYILNDYQLPFKEQLERLHLLPLMYTYELNNLIFFIKSLKAPSDNFDNKSHIQFAKNHTRSGTSSKLVHSKTPKQFSPHITTFTSTES